MKKTILISIGNFFYEPTASIRNSGFSNSAASRKNKSLLQAVSHALNSTSAILSFSRPPLSKSTKSYYPASALELAKSLIYISAPYFKSRYISLAASILFMIRVLCRYYKRGQSQLQLILLYYNPNITHWPLIIASRILGYHNVLQLEDLPTGHSLHHTLMRLALRSFYGPRFFKAWLVTSPGFTKYADSNIPVYCYYGVINALPKIKTLDIFYSIDSARQVLRFLFSGTLDTDSGALLLYKSLLLLQDIYNNSRILIEFHITGSGSLERLFHDLNSTNSLISFIYHGCLLESDFNHLLSQSHFGLSLKLRSGLYGDTTFPSKLFTYLNHSLVPISTRLPQVLECFGNSIIYTDENPDSVAETIVEATRHSSYSFHHAKLSHAYDKHNMSKCGQDLSCFLIKQCLN